MLVRVKRQRLNGDMVQHPTAGGGEKGNASGPGLASHFLIGPGCKYFVMQSSATLQLKKNNHTKSTEQ